MRALRWVAATLVVVVLAVPAAAQVTPDDVEQARQRVAELQADLDGAVVRYDEALTRYNILEGDIAQMSAAIEDTEQRVERSRQLLEDRAIEIYMGAASTGASMLSLSATPEELETGVGYLEELGVSEKELLTGLQAEEAELASLNSELAEARAEQAALRDELGGLVAEIDGQLRTAQDDYETVQAELAAQIEAERRAREEAERRAREQAARDATSTTAPAPSDDPPATDPPSTDPPSADPPADDPPAPTVGDGAGYCPVQGPNSFSDTWGAPRSGGRYHMGVDIMAARGTPVVAVYDGSIYRFSTSSLGGYTIYYQDNSGNIYYYAHLDGYAAGAAAGVPMAAGELLGYVGNTGNAAWTAPHLHWEFHPGGGGAVNPTPLATQLCR
jgi:peptidoglycan LD-endopeptidase LytH